MSGSGGGGGRSEAVIPGAHPSSEGKRRRNRSNVEAMAAKHNNPETGDQQPEPAQHQENHRDLSTNGEYLSFCCPSSEPSVVCKILPSCSTNSSLLKHGLVVMVFDVCFVQYLIHHTAYNLELNFQYCTVLTFPTGPICLLEIPVEGIWSI